MKPGSLFIGRPVHWILLALVFGDLAGLGLAGQHVRNFVWFQFVVLALAAFAVALIVRTFKPGERITREPIEDDEPDPS